ncbi:MAG TPA: hypothetical protein VMB52_06100 [Verrucomicrobiae bacterium]|nr:hypothetical protein [Verrucomicrobiae bacterium]
MKRESVTFRLHFNESEPSMEKQAVLLTGFGDTSLGSTNPSLVAAEEVCQRNIPNINLVYQELPTDNYGNIGSVTEEAVQRVMPDAVLGLGFRICDDTFGIEECAHNYVQPTAVGERGWP